MEKYPPVPGVFPIVRSLTGEDVEFEELPRNQDESSVVQGIHEARDA